MSDACDSWPTSRLMPTPRRHSGQPSWLRQSARTPGGRSDVRLLSRSTGRRHHPRRPPVRARERFLPQSGNHALALAIPVPPFVLSQPSLLYKHPTGHGHPACAFFFSLRDKNMSLPYGRNIPNRQKCAVWVTRILCPDIYHRHPRNKIISHRLVRDES